MTLAAVLLVALTGCGSTSNTPSSTPSGTPAKTATATAVKLVPDVAGLVFQEANNAINSLSISVVVVGRDGKVWTSTYPGPQAKVVSTDPNAGMRIEAKSVKVILNLTEAEQIALNSGDSEAARAASEAVREAEAASKLATRYDFICGNGYGNSAQGKFKSFKEAWTSAYYKSGDTCRVTIDGAEPRNATELLPQEQGIVDIIAANGGDVGSRSRAFGDAMSTCLKVPFGYLEEEASRMDWKKGIAAGALALCPDAPHADQLTEVATKVKISSGTKVVGQTMEPGTYKTKAGVKDCYWARHTGGGDIIDNNFVGFAPDGVTVTVYVGEGFESSRCGVWTKIG